MGASFQAGSQMGADQHRAFEYSRASRQTKPGSLISLGRPGGREGTVINHVDVGISSVNQLCYLSSWSVAVVNRDNLKLRAIVS